MKLVFSLLALLVAGVALAVTVPGFIDWNKYKPQLIAQAEKAKGFDITVDGSLSLSVLPSPKFSIADVKVDNDGAALAALKRLDVQVALVPLLSKKIEVKSVSLEQPVITVRQDEKGRFNFMPPAMDVEEEGAEGGSSKTLSAGKKQDLEVSFDRVAVKGGSLRYFDAKKKEVVNISAADIDVRAGSLQGPFDVKGALKYGEMPVSFTAKAGEIDPKVQSTSLALDAKAGGIDVNYAGVVSFGDAPEVQGELSASVADVGGQGAAKVSGLLTADTKKAVVKDADIMFGEHKATGTVNVSYAPLSVTAQLDGAAFKGGNIKLTQDGTVQVFDVKFAQLSLAPAGFSGFAKNVSAAGAFNAPRLNLNSLNIGEVFGSSLSAKGAVENVSSLEGLDITASGKTADAHILADVFKLDTQSWPKGLKAAEFAVKAKGAISSMDLNASVKAMGGQAIVSGRFSDVLKGLSSSKLAVQVKHPNMAKAMKSFGVEAPNYASFSQEVDFYSDVSIAGQRYDLKSIKAKLAGTSMSGALQYDGSGVKPAIKGDLSFGRLVLQSNKGSSGSGSASNSASAPSKTEPAAGGGKWSSAPLNVDFLHSVNAELAVKAESILYEGWDMTKPSLKFNIQNGTASIDDLSAGLYSGSIGLKGQVFSADKGQPVTLDGQVDITKVQMEPLVKSLAGNSLVKGSGIVSLGSNVKGTGGSMKALIGSLAGQGSVGGSDIVIEGIDVTRFVRALSDDSKFGDSLLHVWKGVGTGGSTAFDTLDGAFVINQGVVNLQKLLLDGPRAAIDTTGDVNLPAWTIKTAHKMSVKDRTDVPPFTMHVEGSLDNPGKTFGQGAIQDIFQRKLQRKLEKVIGGDLGEKLDKELGLDGVLKGVLGGGQTQPAPVPQPEPANDNTPPAQQQEQPQEIDPEEAVKDLIKGLF